MCHSSAGTLNREGISCIATKCSRNTIGGARSPRTQALSVTQTRHGPGCDHRMLPPPQRPFALPGLFNLQMTDAYFNLIAGCFAAAACCFLWFAAFALICFCAACLCTAFGDLSPIISLPFGCWSTDPQHVHFTASDWNREFRRGCCQTANVSSSQWKSDREVRFW